SEDVTKVRKMITEVYDAIRAHDFYTGCGEPDCPWCNFVNQHIIPETFAQADLEELDDEG
ncbi:MAG: hypothetical protein KI786_19325, partial [Mameliella sp.]|nr:hypothetical protein [Phaeodactylibacter sp.]